jgi:membrane-associated phospholipid phosphatase
LLKNLSRLAVFTGILFFLHSPVVFADGSWQSPDPDTSLAHFPTKLVDDLPHLFNTDNLIPFTVGTAATAFDWAVLDEQDTLAADLKSWNTQPLFDFGNFYGEGWVEGFGAVGSWSVGALAQNARLQQFGRDASESLLLSTVLVTGLKYAVGRERPDGSNNQSFPSGHAITAFCFAPIVTKYWGWEAGVPAYLLATVTGLARVEGYHHYLSDVLAGGTLGIVIGNAVVYRPKDVSVSVGPGQMGLKFAFN